jgi:hypothetical protein
MKGFAPTRHQKRIIRIWFSVYSIASEDDPLSVDSIDLPATAGQSLQKLALVHARRILLACSDAHEVIAHRGNSPVPARGDDVLARVCREPFRGCSVLP